MEPFTIIYSFMFEVFGLKGLKKEIFAVIFGFWIAEYRNGNSIVSVPYKTFREITGGSKSMIAKAIKSLESEGLIQATHHAGKKSLYSIDNKVLEVYETRMRRSERSTSHHDEPVSGPNHHWFSKETRSGTKTKPINNKEYKRNRTSGSLAIPNRHSYTGSTLKEII